MFDITNQKSFDSIASWMQDIEMVGENCMPFCKKPWRIWRLIINSSKFCPPNFLFDLDLFLYK